MESILLIDAHSDHYPISHYKIPQLALPLTSPAITGSFGSIYSCNPTSYKLNWLEPEKVRRYGKKRMLKNWNVVEKPAENYNHIDLDVDGLKKWDDSKRNVAFNGRFGTVPLEMVESVVANAESLSVVEIFHGCGDEEYREWLLSEDALESASSLLEKLKKRYEPETCFSVLYENEMKERFPKRWEKARERFNEVGDSIKAERLVMSGNEESIINDGLKHYERVRDAMERGKVMVFSNTHAAVWLTKKREFTFSQTASQ